MAGRQEVAAVARYGDHLTVGQRGQGFVRPTGADQPGTAHRVRPTSARGRWARSSLDPDVDVAHATGP